MFLAWEFDLFLEQLPPSKYSKFIKIFEFDCLHLLVETLNGSISIRWRWAHAFMCCCCVHMGCCPLSCISGVHGHSLTTNGSLFRSLLLQVLCAGASRINMFCQFLWPFIACNDIMHVLCLWYVSFCAYYLRFILVATSMSWPNWRMDM